MQSLWVRLLQRLDGNSFCFVIVRFTINDSVLYTTDTLPISFPFLEIREEQSVSTFDTATEAVRALVQNTTARAMEKETSPLNDFLEPTKMFRIDTGKVEVRFA